MRLNLVLAGAASAIGGAAWLVPADGWACGGLFCNGVQPVIQTGERIVFTVDHEQNTVQAIINIQYQGGASDFSWVLPLQAPPTDISVAPASVFTNIDRVTAPQFNVSVEQKGVCATEVLVFSGDESRTDAGSPNGPVDVISQQRVGPYEAVVLSSTNADDLGEWLDRNGYFVTAEMINVVRPYVATGDVLLALKLLKSADVGDIQPIWLTMNSVEACVPIRLTAFAALNDMDITALVLSDAGRAIPKNFLHIDLNWARLNWLGRGNNYAALVSAAADEGDGNAFTTEFAGSARVFRNQIYRADLYDRAALERADTVGELVTELQRQQINQNPDLGALFSEFIGGQFPDRSIDPTAFVAALWERVVIPEQEVQAAVFDRYAYATRLYTRISPEEMNLDPEFSFRSDLPDVSNVHNARIVVDCGLGGDRNRDATVEIHIQDTGQTIKMPSTRGNAEERNILDSMPAASRIEQLQERRLLKDNAGLISELLDQHNSKNSTCACSSAGAGAFSDRTRTSWLGWMVGAIALLFGRRARPR